MKLLRRTRTKRVFLLRASELQLLVLVLSQFPLRDQDQQISRFGDEEEMCEMQELLNEAMAERRKEARVELDHWLRDKNRFRHTDAGEELMVRVDETNWLLQILNDVRVGAWQRLGAPEDVSEVLLAPNADTVRYLTVMEMAGGFQSVLCSDEEND